MIPQTTIQFLGPLQSPRATLNCLVTLGSSNGRESGDSGCCFLQEGLSGVTIFGMDINAIEMNRDSILESSHPGLMVCL